MESNTSPTIKVDVYQIVTDQIIALLEKGTVPWQKPWTDEGIPMNLLSKRPYRGINLWLLLSHDYERNLFLTWDQLKKVGGSVKRGETGHIVVFWKTLSPKISPEGQEEKPVPLLRYYKVFNVSQCRNLPHDLLGADAVGSAPAEMNTKLDCEVIISSMPQCPQIRHKETHAFYHVADDYINMPKRKSFKSIEGYYSTLFHELVHSTGHEKRLNRKTVTQMAEFGSEMYSLEELVAEMGSAYLSSASGILDAQITKTAAYITGWLGKLKNDKRFIIQASGLAQKAVDFVLNRQVDREDSKDVEQSEMIAGD